MRIRLFSLAGAVLLLSLSGPASPAQAPKDPGPAELFAGTRVMELLLEIPADQWTAMQPTKRAGPGFGPGAAKDGKKPAEKKEPEAKAPDADAKRDVAKRGSFGFDFTYVPADLVADGKRFKEVAVRFKGNSTYMMSASGLKRPFKIDFNRYDEDQRFFGLKEVALGNNAADNTQLRETLAYLVFRAAGIPSPRTAFVQISLTVPGKYDRELLGLYTLIEPIDKTFLRDRFGSAKGLLLKPEKIRGLPSFKDWADYESRYQPKTTPQEAQKQRLIEFTKLVNQDDDEVFRRDIAKYLDVDNFLRYLAANAVIVNHDSFLGIGHNYFLYLHPQKNQFMFLPWDLNMSLGGFPMFGAAGTSSDLSISHPHSGANKLIDRILAMPAHEAEYRKHVARINDELFASGKLAQEIAAAKALVKDALERETVAAKKRGERTGGGFGGGGMFGKTPDLTEFVALRSESIKAQLAGEKKGVVPPSGFGGFGGGPGAMMAKKLIEAADDDKDGKVSQDELVAAAQKLFTESDANSKGQIDQKALTAALGRLLPPPPGFGPAGGKGPEGKGPGGPPGGGFPGGGFPGGFQRKGGTGQGQFLAAALFQKADLKKKGQITVKESEAAARTLFTESDKNKDGKLDEKEIGDAINRLMPFPGFGPGGPGGPGFGPPGGPPPGAGANPGPGANPEPPGEVRRKEDKE